MELSQFNIEYKPRTTIKGQVLADFVAEFTSLLGREGRGEVVEVKDDTAIEVEVPHWKLYLDGSLNGHGSGVGLILVKPSDQKITLVVIFKFKASNNEAEYEALLVGLRLAHHMNVETLSIYGDSQLVVNQIQDEY